MAKFETVREVNRRTVTPEQASNSSSLRSVLGYFQDYIPQTCSSGNTDVVLWARFESADDIKVDSYPQCCDSLLLFVGLSSGCTVWLIQAKSDAKEVYSAVNDGEGYTKVAVLLKSPDRSLGTDKFAHQRPLLAVVRKGSGGYKPEYNVLLIISLQEKSTTGKKIKRIEFERNSIIDVKCNQRVVVVVLQKRLLLLDAASLEKKWVIKSGCQPTDIWSNPIALSTRWLAISDLKVHTHLLSFGGISTGTLLPVASTVINTVKKGFATLSDTLSGLTGSVASGGGNTSDSNEKFHLNVIILDLFYSHVEEINIGELTSTGGIIAHFSAYTGLSTHITVLKFNNNGNLLFTADSEGQIFNIFQICPSILGSSECKVHHLYSLYRGSTTGVVQDVCFSNDSRWIAVSTLNGTTHVFPILLYGGSITVRTHTNHRVVNQLSRYHTSAGIHPTKGSPFHNTPITVSPLKQIKQPYIPSQSNMKNPCTVGNDICENVCVRTMFADSYDMNLDRSVSYSFLIFGGCGLLTQYSLEPYNSKSTCTTDDEESSIELSCSPFLIWKLPNKPIEHSFSIPLVPSSSQQEQCTAIKSTHFTEGVWLSQVELLTYAPPTRRLWMGPQFSFKTVSLCSLKRNDDELVPFSAAISPFHETSGSTDVYDLNIHTSTVASVRERIEEWRSGSNSFRDAGIEIFGSWNDVAPRLKTNIDLEEEILDAMSDTFDQSSVTVVLDVGKDIKLSEKMSN